MPASSTPRPRLSAPENDEPISIIVASQPSEELRTPSFFSAPGSFIEAKLPVMAFFSSYSLGVLLILCVTVIWVASSNWIQYIFGSLHYNKPYFLTYFNTTGFSLWNLGYCLVPRWGKVPWDDRARARPLLVEDPDLLLDADLAPAGRESAPHRTAPPRRFDDASDSSTCSESDVEGLIDVGAIPDLPRRYATALEPERGRMLARRDRVRPYCRHKVWHCAAVFCPFWFLANYLFNVSLSATSVASNTVLSSTSSIWTLLFSHLLWRDSVGPLKCVAVALCVVGSVLVGVSDRAGDAGSGQRATVWGDIAAVLSAFFYATYVSVLRFSLPEDSRYAMGMVFGAVGVINFVCLWPGLILVDLCRLESFQWPTAGQFWPLLLNALIGTNLSDVLWARSVILTSPVVATLGLALTTPLAMVVDAAFKRAEFAALYVVGAVFVMAGFVLVNVPVLEHWPRSWRLL